MRKKENTPLTIGPELMQGFENYKHLESIKDQVERTNRDERFLQGLATEMDGFVKRYIDGDHDIQIGKAFATGIEDHVAVQMFLPMGEKTIFYDPIVGRGAGKSELSGRDCIHGTPVIVMLNDPKLKERIDKRETSNLNSEILALIREKARKGREGEAMTAVDWGGWGHIPPIALGRGDVLLEAKNASGVGYDLVFLPAFMGSMDTLNKDLFDIQDNPNLKELSLGMFTCQLENTLEQLAALMDPDLAEKPEGLSRFNEQAKLFDWLCGHSMGGYIALVASRFNTGLPLIEAIKRRIEILASGNTEEQVTGSVIISEKPAIVGAEYEGKIPDWIQAMVDSDEYQSDHVLLQKGLKGDLIRLGVNQIFRKEKFGELRDFAIKSVAKRFVQGLLRGFLNPDKMMDGNNVFIGHGFSYLRYADYHRLCIRLLDYARPVAGDLTRMRVANSKLDWLRIVFGGEDKVLDHTLGKDLAKGYQLSEDQVHNHKQGVHHGNWEEWLWMMLQGPFAWKHAQTEKVAV